MAKISRPTGLYSIFIGIVGFYYMYGIWKALNSSSTAHGNNYILVTLALIFGTIYWQSKQIEKFTQRSFKDILFSQDIKKRKKGALIFSISVGVATFIAIILSQCIVWFSSEGWLHETAIFLFVKIYRISSQCRYSLNSLANYRINFFAYFFNGNISLCFHGFIYGNYIYVF